MPAWGPRIGFAAALLLAGCGGPKRVVFQDDEGFRLTPPAGWVERVRGDTLSAPHRRTNVPLPPPGAGGKSEQLLARYDRVTSGSLAWLRVTRAESPATVNLKTYVAALSPGAGWKREAEPEELEVGGLPAARLAFRGRWVDQEYRCESVAVRKGDKVYVISGSYPAADQAARDQVRQAVAGAGWR